VRLLAVIVLLAAGCGSRVQSAPQAITGVLLIDGTVRPPVANATVLINRGKVEAMGPAAQLRIPAGYHRIDAKGRVVFPSDSAQPLRTGGEANLVLLNVNPALDPDYLKKVTGRMEGGRWLQFPQ
jgi:hypothetical protein